MPPKTGSIPESEIPAVIFPSKHLQFSFQYLQCDNEKYSLSACPAEYWQLFVRELKRYEGWDTDDFLDQNNEDARHIVLPEDERVDSTAFEGLMNQFEYSDIWQFGLGPRKESKRVTGLLVGSVFYIVLLDAFHNVYASPQESPHDGKSGYR